LLAAAPVRAQPPAPTQPRPTADTAALNAVRAENARLAARVDSLTHGLRDHRFAESFLDSALQQQAALYGVFVTVLVAIFSLATYRDIRSEVRRSDKEMREELKNARDEMRRVEEELRAEVRTALDTHRQESAGWNARLMEAERFMRRAAANAYVAIASVHGPASSGRTIAAHLLASGNFYAAGHDGRNQRVGAANLDAALRVLNGISAEDRQAVAGQMAREAARVAEAFELLRVHAGREADAVVAEIRVRLQELSRASAADAPAPGEPPFNG
jgi:hypothetical protein